MQTGFSAICTILGNFLFREFSWEFPKFPELALYKTVRYIIRTLPNVTGNWQETADLAAFTEEILDGKLHFFVQCVFDKTFFVKTVNGFCPSSSFKDVRLGPEYVIGVKNYYSA